MIKKITETVYTVDNVDNGAISEMTYAEYLNEYWCDSWTNPVGVSSDLYIAESSRTRYEIDGDLYDTEIEAVNAASYGASMAEADQGLLADEWDALCLSHVREVVTQDVYELRSYRAARGKMWHSEAIAEFSTREEAENARLERFKEWHENDSRQGSGNAPVCFFSRAGAEEYIRELAAA
jgi:hypothetical protein